MFTNIDYLTTFEISEVMADCASIDQHIAFVAQHRMTSGQIAPCRASLGWWEQWRLELRRDILDAMDDVMNPDHFTV